MNSQSLILKHPTRALSTNAASCVTVRKRSGLPILLAAALGAASASWAADLELTGMRWQQPHITYFIAHGGDVAESAVNDVQTALEDWNLALGALSGSAEVPVFEPARTRKSADLVIDLRVRQRRNVLGGTVELSGSSSVDSTGCVINGANIAFEGTLFGDSRPGGLAMIRTAARHRIGRILGLGVVQCGSAGSSSTDLMDLAYVNSLLWSGTHDLDVGISECDLDGIATLYDPADDCGTIPLSIPFTCP